MESALEIGRNALLLTLVVLLIVILYKRTLVFMNKRSETGTYFEITGFTPSKYGTTMLELSVPESTVLKVEVHSEESKSLLLSEEKEFLVGEHDWEFNLQEMNAGKYTLIVSADNAKVTRFFNL